MQSAEGSSHNAMGKRGEKKNNSPRLTVVTLLPPEDDAVAPVYAQLYIYDSDVALRHHIANPWNARLNAATLGILQDMLYCCHPAVQLYKQAYELTRNMPSKQQCQIALHFDSSCDQCHYQAHDALVNEIAVILPGDGVMILPPISSFLSYAYLLSLYLFHHCLHVPLYDTRSFRL